MRRFWFSALAFVLGACGGSDITSPPPPPPPHKSVHPAIYPAPQKFNDGVTASIRNADVTIEPWSVDSTVYAVDGSPDTLSLSFAARVVNTVDSTPIVGAHVVWMSSVPPDLRFLGNLGFLPGLVDTTSVTDANGNTSVNFLLRGKSFDNDGDFETVTAVLIDSTGAIQTQAKFYVIKKQDARVVAFWDGVYNPDFIYRDAAHKGGVAAVAPWGINVPVDFGAHMVVRVITGADLKVGVIGVDSLTVINDHDPHQVLPCTVTGFVVECSDAGVFTSTNLIRFWLHADDAPAGVAIPAFISTTI